MGRNGTSVRQRVGFFVVVVGALAALLAPSVALAANTASFSYRTPGSGTSTTNTRPSIAVRIYDRYGIRGSSNFYMSVDKVPVKPSVTYTVSGAFDPSRPDYRRSRITYRPSTPLSPGTHRVYVRVKDRAGRYSSTTWYFKVTAPEEPYNAQFSAPAPAAGSSSTVSTPTISLTAYDKYGVSGTGKYSLKIDGIAVPTSIKYATSGVYTNFTLSHKVSTPLSVGTHTLSATVTDLHNHVSTYSWTYVVQAPEPVYQDMPIAGTACGACHVGYPTAHPMTACASCHADTAPARPSTGLYGGGVMSGYVSGNKSAHTISCSLESPCHGGGGPFPHALDTDCARCHSGQYAGIPGSHSLDVASVHEAPTAFCTARGCHLTSVTKEHYRYTVSGIRLSCATCHGATDQDVVAAIAAGSTSCTSCHDLAETVHPGTAVAHAAANTCIAAGCHVTDVTTIHNGNCLACHATGVTPSTTCSSCHATGSYHASMGESHALQSGGCVGTGCHLTDASTVHKNVCSRCHSATTTASTNCATCHGDSVLSLHPGATIAHTAAVTFCTTSSCHGTAVTPIHGAEGGPGCVACHATGKTPSTVCSSCHVGDIATVHASAAASHAAPAVSCIGSSCHNTDVSVIHDDTDGPGCVACHGDGITPTTQCASCHPGDIALLHASAGVSHTAVNATCITAGCHLADVTEVHGALGGPGCAACHGQFLTPTTLCSACHPGDVTSLHSSANALHATPTSMCVTACHATNVASVHAAGPGCVACHASGISPAVDCAACHSGTASALHSYALGMHVAAPGSCVTAGCHASDAIALHDAAGSGPGCAACHAPGVSPTLVCGSCHAGDVQTIHAYAAAAHATEPGLSCVASVCHEASALSIHSRPDGPSCAACHAQGVTPSVTCASCHPGDVVSVHSAADEPHTVLGGCSSATCHTSGNLATIHQPSTSSCAACHAPNVTATAQCGQCHLTANIPTLHASADVQHTGTLDTCVASGCHAANVAVLHLSSPGCNVCHATGAPTTVTCTNSGCHSSSISTVHAGAAIAHVAPSGLCVRSGCHGGDLTTIHYANGTGPGCVACHAQGVTPSATCANCHPATESEAHVQALDDHTVTQTTCGGYAGTSPCHHSRVDSTHRTAPNGCLSCHAVGVTPSTTCATCHTGTGAPSHSSATVPHAAIDGLCSNSQCHSVDASLIHAESTKSCLACHAAGVTPSTTCATCHTDDPFVTHTGAAAAHVSPATASCVVSGCHDDGTVTEIHELVGCTVCHNTGVTATTSCSTIACHGKYFEEIHDDGAASHVIASTCVRSGCHAGDAVDLHAGGPNCAACHDNALHAPSVVCADCHPGETPQIVHAPYVGTSHDPAPGACTSIGCHAGSVSGTHSTGPSCVPCHQTGPLTVECLTCHVETLAPVHASAETSHTAPTGSCVKAGCHASNVATLHAASTRTCSACHNNTSFPTLDCTTCHFSDFTSEHPAPVEKHTTSAPNAAWCTVSTCHVTNAASIHTLGTTPPGCAACHSPERTASLDCSAAGCHPSAVPNNHPAPATPHISTDGCVTTCHVANVATIHGAGQTPPGCVACHAYGKPHSTTCSQCHTAGTYHGAAAVKHAVSNSCIKAGCHQSDVSLIHVEGAVQHCEACHASGKTPSTDCTACHGLNADHRSAHDSTCNGCHNIDHWGGPSVGATDNGYWYAQYNTCTTCHTGAATWVHPWTCHGCDGYGVDNQPFPMPF